MYYECLTELVCFFFVIVKNGVNQRDFVLFLSSTVKVDTEDVGTVPNKVECEKRMLGHESWSHKQDNNFCFVLYILNSLRKEVKKWGR